MDQCLFEWSPRGCRGSGSGISMGLCKAVYIETRGSRDRRIYGHKWMRAERSRVKATRGMKWSRDEGSRRSARRRSREGEEEETKEGRIATCTRERGETMLHRNARLHTKEEQLARASGAVKNHAPRPTTLLCSDLQPTSALHTPELSTSAWANLSKIIAFAPGIMSFIFSYPT